MSLTPAEVAALSTIKKRVAVDTLDRDPLFYVWYDAEGVPSVEMVPWSQAVQAVLEQAHE